MENDIRWVNLERVLNEFADAVIEKARENLERNGTNASYGLYDSIGAEKIVEIGEDRFSVKISLADYWKYVENGRGPGKYPPPDAIRKWIEVKPVSIQPDRNGRIPSVEQVTFLVSRKIAEEGTEPQPFLEPAKDEVLARFEPLIDQAIQDDIDTYINDLVEGMMKRIFGR